MKEIKTEVEDIEFVEVDSHNVHQLCMACLCATRTTQMLNDDTLKQYYMNILTEMQPDADVPVLQSQRLCWECVAHLKRWVHFREQVHDSYRLLQRMLPMCDKENLAEFLQSSACLSAGRLKTCCAFSIDISPRDDDKQEMTADEDDDDKAAVKEYLENRIETHPSTFRESDCISEDLGEQLVEIDGHTRTQIINCVSTTSINTPNYTCDVSTDELKRFQCEVCYKSFSQKNNVLRHLKTHTGEKLFQCEMCHKSFSQNCNLVRHRRTHTNDKPFECEVCHKPFAQKCHLIRHIRTHADVKPIQCELCHKSFTGKHYLRTHMKFLHPDEKPYKCEKSKSICIKI